MKHLIKLPALLLFVFLLPQMASAQQERNKIVMTVNFGGKNITADLSTVNYGISRYGDYAMPMPETAPPPATGKDKDKKPAPPAEKGSYYMSMTVKSVSTDLLKLMAKKDTRFNGTITITDTFGRNPVREIKFTNASVESYSDQYTSYTYEDNYAVAAISINCSGLIINGVTLE